jgi:centrin-3
MLRQVMIGEFDLDQDGEINEQEFFAIMMDNK